MTPIFGIIASQITGHLSTNSYESIATVTVGAGGSGSISFTSIPSTYKHLQLRVMAKDNRATTSNNVLFRFNSDSATNYSYHLVYGDGASAGVDTGTSVTAIYSIIASNSASGFGVNIMDILDYADINKYKTTRTLIGFDNNDANGRIGLFSGNWRSTSAINRIDVAFNSATALNQYSSLALYGIKG